MTNSDKDNKVSYNGLNFVPFITHERIQQRISEIAAEIADRFTEDIKDRHVIIVEDIVDTGHTISHLLDDLRNRQPASLSVATLLFKPESELFGVKPDYIGFNIPPAFIIGFGLDLDGKARNLRDIYVIEKQGQE